MKMIRKLQVAAGSGVALIVAGFGMGWYGFPALAHWGVLDGLALRDGTLAYERWLKLPQPIDFKVYLLNVTNPEEVSQGARPILKEIGPYVYDEYREKFDVVPHPEDDSISFRQRQIYKFNEERSGKLRESDKVTILNVILVGVALLVQEMFPYALAMMDPIIDEIFVDSSSAFRTVKVGDLLWGDLPAIDCRSPEISGTGRMICDAAEGQLPATVRQKEPNLFTFSFFSYKNNTDDGLYRTGRGLKDYSKTGIIYSWENKSSMKTWKPLNSSCNDIKGTDSTIFPPFRNSSEKLYVFSPDICRSVSAEFEKEEKVDGIPVHRYAASPDVMKVTPETTCLCKSDEFCLEDGAIDLNPCLNAPIAMSYPHFYGASESYTKYPIGLNPSKEKHETFMLLEPQSGVPLIGAKRVQLNIPLIKVPELTILANVSEGMFPIVWIEEGIVLKENLMNEVRFLYTVLRVFGVLKWAMMALGVIIMIMAAGIYTYRRNNDSGSANINSVSPVLKSGYPPNKISVSTVGSIYPETVLPPKYSDPKRPVTDVFE